MLLPLSDIYRSFNARRYWKSNALSCAFFFLRFERQWARVDVCVVYLWHSTNFQRVFFLNGKMKNINFISNSM